MAKETPNWKNIRKLLKHLETMKQTRHRKFRMPDYIQILDNNHHDKSKVKIKELRENGPACASAGCLAGEAVIALSPTHMALPLFHEMTSVFNKREGVYSMVPFTRVNSGEVHDLGQELLGLTNDEALYMFTGMWAGKPREDITKKDAIKYLRKVLKEEYIKVAIYEPRLGYLHIC
jgi:hypothetical protein